MHLNVQMYSTGMRKGFTGLKPSVVCEYYECCRCICVDLALPETVINIAM